MTFHLTTQSATPMWVRHLTLLLDLPVEAGLARRSSGGGENHFDRETLAFHERVRGAYLELARETPQTWRVIDASQPFEVVRDAAVAAVREVLGARA